MIVNCAYDEMVPIHKLVRNPRNPNTHPEEQIRLLAKVIDYQGWRNPIVVSTRSGFIVKGHARLTAAEVLGLEEVPVDYQDYESEAQEWADMLADNRLAELAEIDRTVLKDLIEEMDTGAIDMELTGYTDQVIEDLMTEFHTPSEGLTDDDAIPEPTESICKKGDLWSLGNHRLLCGDATVITDVEKLMAGEKAKLCLTDPPYGIGEKFGDYVDSPENLEQLISGFLPLAQGISKRVLLTPGNSHQFLYPKPDWVLAWFCSAGVGVNPWGYTCWNAIFAYGKDPYLQASKGSRPDAMVMNEASEKLNHPTVKPIGVWSWILERGSIKVGDLIYDPFGGSGSTLIACEKLDRRCYMMEIDEHYCDVIIKRWEDFTGSKAVKL